jgi:hypothetical protein
MLTGIKNTFGKIIVLLIICSTFFFQACEPEYCASCYDYTLIIRDKTIYICADNLDDLYWLMDESEYMGYECEEDW